MESKRPHGCMILDGGDGLCWCSVPVNCLFCVLTKSVNK